MFCVLIWLQSILYWPLFIFFACFKAILTYIFLGFHNASIWPWKLLLQTLQLTPCFYLTDIFVFVAVIICAHKMPISMDSSARKGELSHPAIAVFFFSFLSVQTYHQPCKSSLAVIIVPASCYTHAVISGRDSGRSLRVHEGVWSSDGHAFFPCIHSCNPTLSY